VPGLTISCADVPCCVIRPQVLIKDNWGWYNNGLNRGDSSSPDTYNGLVIVKERAGAINVVVPLSVSITVPSNNSTLLGMATIRATANSAVNVRFLSIDVRDERIDIGSDDTAPYQISWDTTSVSNGPYTIRAVATDSGGATETDEVTVTVNNIAPDTTPPERSNRSPAGTTFPAGTPDVTLSLNTNENATCRYAESAGTPFNNMADTFSNTGGTSHSTIVLVTDGNSYNYYVRCQDESLNANDTDYRISFFTSSPIPLGLTHWWKLEDNANDFQGSLNGAATAVNWIPGQIGRAARFNGVNSIIDFGDASAIDLLISSNFSLLWWFRTTGIDQDMISKKQGDSWDSYDGQGIQAYIASAPDPNNGKLRIRFASGRGNVAVSSDTPDLNNGNWHHAGFVRSSGNVYIYVDGRPEGSMTALMDVENGADFNIGGRTEAGNYFSGDIDEVQIYNRALTSVEVQDVYSIAP